MPPGIFEHHGLVHHGELEMGGRVVDRDARVLGQRHDDQRGERQPERDAQAGVGQHEVGDHRKLGRAGEQGDGEGDHDHRRLGKRGEHHLAARADAAEAGADVHADQRQEEARRAEERGDGDQVGRPAELEAGGEGRDERGGDPGGGEDHVGAGAEQPGRVLRQHGLLADQAQEVAIGLEDRRPAPAQEARLELARVAEKERREQEHEDHLRALRDETEDQVHTSITIMRRNKRVTSAPKTRLRNWRMVRNCR